MVRSIGADQVIDYAREDFAQKEQLYDLIFDVVAKRSFSDCKRVLGPGGIYVTTEFSPVLALRGLWSSVTGDKKMVPLLAKPPTKEDLVFMKELLEVPEALRYLKEGHARGKIVITM